MSLIFNKSIFKQFTKWGVTFFLLAVVFESYGQSVAQLDTNSTSPPNSYKYFLQADMQVSQIVKNAGMFTSFSACWLFTKNYYLGIQYQKLTSEEAINKFVPNTSIDDIILEHQSAGIKAGYILFSKKRISFNPEATINWAMCKYQYPVGAIYRNNFLVFEPAANILFNLHKNLAAGLGISYRFNAGLQLNGLSSSDLNGFAGRVFIRFGKLK